MQVNPGLLLDQTVLAFVLSDFIRTGILDSFAARGSVTQTELDLKYPDNPLFLNKAIHILCTARVLAKGPNCYVKGPLFHDFWRYAGPIHWLIHGNSRLLLEGPATTTGSADALRDYSAIARSSTLAGKHLIDPFLEQIWAKLSPNFIVDIGCGSAHRLIALLRHFESLKALGIDRSKDALTLAQHNVETEGLSERISLVHADVMEMNDTYPKIDLVFPALMAHDIGSKINPVAGFQRIRIIFPNAKQMLIVDTCRVDEIGSDVTFIEPFEYVHSLLGITLASVSEWRVTFHAAGWWLQELIKTGLPNTFAFLLSRIDE